LKLNHDDTLSNVAFNVNLRRCIKGGPKNLLGKWTGKGIMFPDGNEWKKL